MGMRGVYLAWKITSTDSIVMLSATDCGEFGIASPTGRQGWAVATFAVALPKGLKLRNTSSREFTTADLMPSLSASRSLSVLRVRPDRSPAARRLPSLRGQHRSSGVPPDELDLFPGDVPHGLQ